MSATASRRKPVEDEDKQEKLAKSRRDQREQWVHDNIYKLVPGLKDSAPAKIVVHNVYGDRFRVNIYSKGKDSDAGVITALALSRSEFLTVAESQAA
jgi:poly(A) polymerase Pap1